MYPRFLFQSDTGDQCINLTHMTAPLMTILPRAVQGGEAVAAAAGQISPPQSARAGRVGGRARAILSSARQP